MENFNSFLTNLDVGKAAFWGHAIGVVLRFALPLLIKFVKSGFKPLPVEWKYAVPGLYAQAMAVPASFAGLPALLQTWNVNPESRPVPLMVLVAAVYVGWVGMDSIRELIRPTKPKAIPEGGL